MHATTTMTMHAMTTTTTTTTRAMRASVVSRGGAARRGAVVVSRAGKAPTTVEYVRRCVSRARGRVRARAGAVCVVCDGGWS
mmetsp:Transcript_540/g.1716  ORF Transcript_540/g.1716 Transcript_540/m.1716 type:complete len:82 (-) Transcript_540:358-603(-)